MPNILPPESQDLGLDTVSASTLFLPPGTNKVAKECGKLLRAFATKVRWPDEELTNYDLNGRIGSELGVHPKLIHRILEGRAVPPPEVARRMVQWMWEGDTFTDKPLSRTAMIKAEKTRWRQVKVTLEKSNWLRASRAAKRLNISLDELCAVAIVRLLDNEPVLSTLQKAVDTLEKVRLRYLFSAAPELKTLLRGTLKLATGVWTEAKRSAPEQPRKEPTHVQQLQELGTLSEWEEKFL